MLRIPGLFIVCAWALLLHSIADAAEGKTDQTSPLRVGYARVDVTPDVTGERPVWMAGQERNRRAEGVRDPLYATSLVLDDGGQRIALVAVDTIGVQYPLVKEVRQRLTGFDYVLVASTHTHEGPDVIGLWGPSATESGVDPEYLEQLTVSITQSVREAAENLVEVTAFYGTADDGELLKDYRLPEVFDPTLRVLRFDAATGKPAALLVQWNSHPIEPDGNRQLTRDYIGVTCRQLEQELGCPVIFFPGAVGGLMGTPGLQLIEKRQLEMPKDVYDFIRIYGEQVGQLASQANVAAEPVTLTPLVVKREVVGLPLDNQGFRQARAIGVLTRSAYDADDAEFATPLEPAQLTGQQVTQSEVAYLQLGEVHVASIPGELYPELVYGEMPEQAPPEADFPSATPEPALAKILPGEKILVLGLANDAVGYIIPKGQWDVEPPFIHGRAQYGEVNSLGPETAGTILRTLQRLVEQGE